MTNSFCRCNEICRRERMKMDARDIGWICLGLYILIAGIGSWFVCRMAAIAEYYRIRYKGSRIEGSAESTNKNKSD